MSDTKYRLRHDVYASLVRARGATTVAQQVELFGIHRATLYRIRGGQSPSLSSAMSIATTLGVPLDALFERVGDNR